MYGFTIVVPTEEKQEAVTLTSTQENMILQFFADRYTPFQVHMRMHIPESLVREYYDKFREVDIHLQEAAKTLKSPKQADLVSEVGKKVKDVSSTYLTKVVSTAIKYSTGKADGTVSKYVSAVKDMEVGEMESVDGDLKKG